MHIKSLLISALLVFILSSCTNVAIMPDNKTRNDLPNACNVVEHIKCVYITGKETLEDGYEKKFTRHWWRMSYIGQACEKRYGKTLAYLFEGFFAIPHYTLIAIGNTGAALLSPFIETDNEKKHKQDKRNKS